MLSYHLLLPFTAGKTLNIQTFAMLGNMYYGFRTFIIPAINFG